MRSRRRNVVVSALLTRTSFVSARRIGGVRSLASSRGVVRILDGGLSTQLEHHHGVDLTQFPKLWTAGLLEDENGRSALRAAHDAYIRSGASIILTSSYQTSPATDAASLAASVDLALEARDASTCAAEAWLSLGPYGATLADGSEYRGDYSLDETALREWHASRLSLLVGGSSSPRHGIGGGSSSPRHGIDGLAFETIPNIHEVRAILRIICEDGAYRPLPAWISFSCRDATHLADGTPLIDVAGECRAAFAMHRLGAPTFLGANCVDPAIVHRILDALLVENAAPSDLTGMTGIVLYPNGGGHWDAEQRCWRRGDGESAPFSEAPATLATQWAHRITAAGMEAIIGGCCETDQTTIRALREALVQ